MPFRRPALHPFETVALIALGLGVGVPVLLGLPPGRHTFERAAKVATGVLPLALVLGVGGGALMRANSPAKLRAYVARLATREWWVLWLRFWLACLATSTAYFWSKLCLPLVRSANYDGMLWQLDRALHFGVSPSHLVLSLAPASGALALLDYAYGLWLVTLVAALAFVAAAENDALRRSFLLSCLILWVVGALLYALVPAQGPAYAFPSVARELHEGLRIAPASQQLLGANYARVVAGGGAGLSVAADIDPTRGVAAFPSLHVAFHMLFAFWAWSGKPRLFPLLAALAVLTLFSSVRTGWHYAIDGYAGALLAWLAWRIALAVEPVDFERAAIESAGGGAAGPVEGEVSGAPSPPE